MRYALTVAVDRCVGCETCAVACMDQNDLEVAGKEQGWRRVFCVESGTFPDADIDYVSLGCLHCEDAPCMLACPTGAIRRDPSTGAVDVDAPRCIGCHSCSMACPFGIPRYGADGRMEKCHLCSVRVEHGLEPACVRACPTKALRFGPANVLADQTEELAARRLVSAARKGASDVS